VARDDGCCPLPAQKYIDTPEDHLKLTLRNVSDTLAEQRTIDSEDLKNEGN
jgi:hypothetical protein